VGETVTVGSPRARASNMATPSEAWHGGKRKRRKRGARARNKGGGVMVLSHWNAQAVLDKEEMLKEFMVKHGAAYCGISESHTYHAQLSDRDWKWDPGKEHRPKYEHRRPPQGIGAFTDRSIQAAVVRVGEYSMWTRIEVPMGLPLFVAETYFPHSSKTSEHRAAWGEIREAVIAYRGLGHIVIMGDFNAHTGACGDKTVDAAGRLMLKKVNQMRLHIVNSMSAVCTDKFTRVMRTEKGVETSTTIDYAIVSQSLLKHITKLSFQEDRMGSDHKPLILRLLGLSAGYSGTSPMREVWRVEDIPEGKSGLAQFSRAFQTAFQGWIKDAKSTIAAMDAVDADSRRMADVLEWSFQKKLDEIAYAQIGKKWVGPASSPLLDGAIRGLNSQRRACEIVLKDVMGRPDSTEEEKVRAVRAYRNAKSKLLGATRAKREASELELFTQIEQKQADSKLFWARFKRVAGGLRSSVSPPPMVEGAEGGIETDPLAVLRTWKRFSSAIASPGFEEECIFDEEHRVSVEERLSRLRAVRLAQPELDGLITEREVFRAIRKLKAGKAPGVDGILTSILKPAAAAVGADKLGQGNTVVEALTLLFNFVFENEVWPERWGSGIVFPLYKQDSRLDPGNYRPITLLSVVGKLFGSVLEARLSAWSEDGCKMADEQGGFRRGRGTPDLIFVLRELISVRKAQGLPTMSTFIDARKAYDTVWREGNYVRLHDMGVRGKMWRQLQEMNKCSKSKIRLPFGETEWFNISRGVAQGAVESPWLYSCFINGMAEELKSRGLGVQVGGSVPHSSCTRMT
jgi:hypothetical protein